MTDEQEKEGGVQIPLLTFTNDKSAENLGMLQGLLKMVIHTVYTGQLACMQAKNTETGKEELILVGVAQGENGGVACYPLFAPIRAEDVGKYLAPTGDGGFTGEAGPSEVSADEVAAA